MSTTSSSTSRVEISADSDGHRVRATLYISDKPVGSVASRQLYASDLRWCLPTTCGPRSYCAFTARLAGTPIGII